MIIIQKRLKEESSYTPSQSGVKRRRNTQTQLYENFPEVGKRKNNMACRTH